MSHKKSMNGKLAPLSVVKVRKLRAQLNSDIEGELNTVQGRIRERAREHEREKHKTGGWKNKILGIEETEEEKTGWNIDQARPYLWETQEARKVLTREESAGLTDRMKLMRDIVKDPISFKYLQINVFTEILNELISEA